MPKTPNPLMPSGVDSPSGGHMKIQRGVIPAAVDGSIQSHSSRISRSVICGSAIGAPTGDEWWMALYHPLMRVATAPVVT